MNESLVKYLAGLLDADGSMSFNFKRDPNRPELHFVSVSVKLAASTAIDHHGFVASLPSVTGMGTVCRSGDDQQFITWSVNRRADVEMLVPRLVKHMVIKAKHWQWIFETWRQLRSATVTEVERSELALAAKESRRSRNGPLKAKNHPTWAWLAGYLDGDGWFLHRFYPKNSHWAMRVGAVAHDNDADVLRFIERSFGGVVKDHTQTANVKIWSRGIGHRDSSFALSFLPNLAKHSRLKRHKIDQLIHHHRQRLSEPSPAG